jgi:hypothetical protein
MLNYLNNYLKKFAMDILPSVAATIIGAYIVNHYIVTKPGADAPVAAAVSAADPKADAKPADPKSAEAKPADAGNLPAAGVKAKGISEKAIMEKTAAERPTVVEKPQEKADAKAEPKSDVKSADAPAETASVPPRHTSTPREKVRVVLPSPVQAVTPPVSSAVAAAPVAAPPVETASVPDERRDANDLARAAIERLRGTGDNNSPRAPEVARPGETSRVETPRIETPRVATAPALRPLPPPITVSTPAGEPLDQASSQTRPPYAANAAIDPRRPTPPADIPLTRPLDLRAEVTEPSVREHTSVAEDVLSATKSMFHTILRSAPGGNNLATGTR